MNKKISTNHLFTAFIIVEILVPIYFLIKPGDGITGGLIVAFDIIFFIATIIAWVIDWRTTRETK